MSNQPQQQQQSSSEEGSKENTILNGPRHLRERSAQNHPSGPADSMPQGPAPAAPTSQTGGPTMGSSSQQSEQRSPGPHQNTMETTNGSTRSPVGWAKAQELLKQEIRHQNLILEFRQVQVLPHSLLIHLRTLLYVQHVAKVATGVEIVLIIISVTFVG